MTASRQNALMSAVCVIFAIALQVQVTLFQSETYLGLRINLGDILIPFAGLAILYDLYSRKSRWPAWNMPHFYAWIAGLTFILGAALLHTHFTFGEISRWALINKFFGWFVLMALLCLGGWIGTNAKKQQIELFVKVFLYFALFVIATDLIGMILQVYWKDTFAPLITYVSFPIAGYMVNRNAFAVLYLAVFCLSSCLYFSNTSIFKQWYMPALLFLTPFFVALNGSRAMMISLGLTLIVFIACNIRDQKQKTGKFLLCLLLGAAAFGGVYHDKKDELFIMRGKQLNFVSHLGGVLTENLDTTGLSYPGDSMRLTILADAKEMIAERPIVGSGLGSMLLYQEQKHGQIINLIDCMPLWLLVETGLIGLLAFAAFYIQSFRKLYSHWKQDEGFARALSLGIIASMACFTIMGLFHELMYTRFVWILLGIGLTMPQPTKA